jgi:hypothetical protein
MYINLPIRNNIVSYLYDPLVIVLFILHFQQFRKIGRMQWKTQKEMEVTLAYFYIRLEY